MQVVKGLKLVGRMHGGAGDVFVETDLLRVALGVDQTRDHVALGDLLSLRQQPQRQPTSLPDGHQPKAGHCAGRVALGLDHRLLQETLGCDARGQGFDGLWAVSRLARVARRLLELVEGDFDLGARDDLDWRHLGHDDLLGVRVAGAQARLRPCPSARPGVQAEARFRGEPAAGPINAAANAFDRAEAGRKASPSALRAEP